MESFLLSIAVWRFISVIANDLLSNEKVAKNAVHMIHALLFIFLFHFLYDSSYHAIAVFSSGFYVYDLLVIAKNMVQHIDQCFYVLHHVIALYGFYLVYNDVYSIEIMQNIYYLEVSNITLYISYHIRHTYEKYDNLNMVSECFQFVWYTYYRVVVVLKYSYTIRHVYKTTPTSVNVSVFIVFMMGVVWSTKLFLKCQKNLLKKNNYIC